MWQVETPAGDAIGSADAEVAINPASVVKVATTLWALDVLGAEHRFTTRFDAAGTLDPEGRLHGDLVVVGGADPDFHVENAYLVARALNEAGVREVEGDVVVDGAFWIGWEGGSERREADPLRRATAMAERLRAALDPARRDAATRQGLAELRERRGWQANEPPGLQVHGAARGVAQAPPGEPLVEHRSNPLRLTLKRLNAYSNNDIERLGVSLGEPPELAGYLERRGLAQRPVFATLSGLGSNRLSCRDVTWLLRELREQCAAAGIEARDLLPVSGCDPGTLEHFPALSQEDLRGAVVAKTGTLTTTDGGVAVLAGFAATSGGERVFCVASPGIGNRVRRPRAAQERWLLELLERNGGAVAGACGSPVVYSDSEAAVEITRAPRPR